MNNIEFIQFVDVAIHDEMLLGPNKNENRLIGLRNIKSDFNYIASTNNKLSTSDILKRLYKERLENSKIYLDANKHDLWFQEHTELGILENYLPKEPTETEILSFLSTLIDIPKQKSSFKKYQEACSEKFGQMVNSKIILNFIEN